MNLQYRTHISQVLEYKARNGIKYSRMDQVKFVEDRQPLQIF